MSQFSTAQTKTDPVHWVILITTFFYGFFNMIFPDIKVFSIIAIILLFLAFTWRKICTIVIIATITVGLIKALPFLAPIAFIIMVVIFFMRIKYILSNLPAVIAGFYMYGIAYYFVTRPHAAHLPLALFTAVLATLVFHVLLKWLYACDYTLEQALPIMGVVPLLIILLFLPFIKAFDIFDVGAHTSNDAIDVVDTHGNVHHGGHTATEVSGHHYGEHINTEATTPGHHHTQGYTRMGPDGTPHYVRGYVATNPDGIVENNYSYRGTTIDVTPTHVTTHVQTNEPIPHLVRAHPAMETATPRTVADYTIVADPGPERKKEK